jgi:hypothetical protein
MEMTMTRKVTMKMIANLWNWLCAYEETESVDTYDDLNIW